MICGTTHVLSRSPELFSPRACTHLDREAAGDDGVPQLLVRQLHAAAVTLIDAAAAT